MSAISPTPASTPDWNLAPLAGLSQVKGRTDATVSDAPIGQFLAGEIKAEGGRVSPKQAAFIG